MNFRLHDFIRSVFVLGFFWDSPSVLRRPGAAPGACVDGAREAGERSGHLSPGRHALFSGVFPRQDSRYEGLLWSIRTKCNIVKCVVCFILKCSPFAA